MDPGLEACHKHTRQVTRSHADGLGTCHKTRERKNDERGLWTGEDTRVQQYEASSLSDDSGCPSGGSPCAAMAQGGLHCHHQSPSDASGSWPCMYTYKHTYTHPYIKMYLDIQISGCMQREIGALQAGPGGHVHMQTYIYPHAYTPMYIDVLYTSFFHTI